jgi:hypothetical protein
MTTSSSTRGEKNPTSSTDISPVWAEARTLVSTPVSPRRTRYQTAAASTWGIEFTDPEIESASVFQWFMSIATTLKVSFPPSQVNDLGALLLFMRKWGADALYDLVRTKLLTAIPRCTLPLLKLFNIGAMLDDIEMCKAVLRRKPTWPFHGDWTHGVGPRSHLFDHRGWTLSFWREHSIPPEYMFALGASGAAASVGGEALAARFETALMEARSTARKDTTTA